MKNATLITVVALSFVLFTSSAQALNIFSVASGDFNTTGNWSGGALPGNFVGSNNNISQGGNDMTTSANHTPTTENVTLIVRSNDGGGNQSTLNLGHDLDTGLGGANAGSTLIGFNNGHYGTVNHTAGTLTTGSLQVGDTDGSAPFTSFYNLSGTSAISASAITVQHDAIFDIQSSTASVTTGSMTLSSTTADIPTLDIAVTGTSSPLNVTGLLTLGATSALTVDLSGIGPEFNGGDIVVMDYGTLAGMFTTVNLIGGKGTINHVFDQGGGDLAITISNFGSAIPEPSTALLAVLGLIGLVSRRQRRR
jgi:hypothetical protein